MPINGAERLDETQPWQTGRIDVDAQLVIHHARIGWEPPWQLNT
jgi:hypothetical protein